MPYNAQFDLRGTQIKSNFNQITQYDTSSGNWFLGEGQQVDVSSSYTISASNATNAQNAYYSLLSSNTTSASYAQTASMLVGFASGTIVKNIDPNPSLGNIKIGNGSSVILEGNNQSVILDNYAGSISLGFASINLSLDAGSEMLLNDNGTIDMMDISAGGLHFDGTGSVYFDHNVTASTFNGDGFNLTNLSWSFNSDTSSLSLSSSYTISASYTINADTSSISISSSYAVNTDTASIAISTSYTLNADTASYITSSNVIGTVTSSSYSTLAVTMPYSSSIQNFDNIDNLSTGSMYLQVGPPTFLFVYDGTVWRSSSLA